MDPPLTRRLRVDSCYLPSKNFTLPFLSDLVHPFYGPHHTTRRLFLVPVACFFLPQFPCVFFNSRPSHINVLFWRAIAFPLSGRAHPLTLFFSSHPSGVKSLIVPRYLFPSLKNLQSLTLGNSLVSWRAFRGFIVSQVRPLFERIF